MTQLAIQTRDLSKHFGSKIAVRGLNLEVGRGEAFGFLGPNGAGKSTSIKMMLGLICPTGGDVRLLGHPPRESAARVRVGFLPEHFRFYDWLTAHELLMLHGRLYGLSNQELHRRVPYLLERVGLAGARQQRLRGFSKGMLQRAGLAQALLNDPEVLFLDEPTSGLDPGGRLLVRDILREQRQRGVTIFLNSHLLGEVELTCDRAAFVRNGEVLEIRTLDGSIPAGDGLTVSLRVRGLTPAMAAELEQWADSVRQEGDRWFLQGVEEEQLPELHRRLVQAGADVFELASHRPSLEDLFLRIVGREGGL